MYFVLYFFVSASADFANLLERVRGAINVPDASEVEDRVQDRLAALGFDDKVDSARDAGEEFLESLGDKVEDAQDAGEEFLGRLGDQLDDWKDRFTGDADDDADNFFDRFDDHLDDWRDDLKAGVEQLQDRFEDADPSDFAEEAQDFWEEFTDDLKDRAEDFVEDASDLIDEVDVDEFKDRMGDAMQAAAGELRQAVNGAWKGIRDMSVESELLFGLDDNADPILDLGDVLDQVLPHVDGRRRRAIPDGLPIPHKWRGTPQGGWAGALGLSDELTKTKECLIYMKDAKFVPGVFEPYIGGWMCRNKRTKRVEDVYMAVGVKGCIPMSNSMYTNNGVVEINLITQRIDVCDAALMAATAGVSKAATSAALKAMGKTSTRFSKFLSSERFTDKVAKRVLERQIKKQVKSVITPKYDQSAGGCKQLGSLLTMPFSNAIKNLEMLVCFLENLGRGNGAARGAARTLKSARDSLKSIENAMKGIGVGDALNKLSDAMYIQFEADATMDLNTLNTGVKLTFELKYDVLGLYKAAISSACEVTSTWKNVCDKVKKACGPFAFFCGWVTQCHWEQITRPLTTEMANACRHATGLLGHIPNTAIHVKETIPITSGRLVQRSGIWSAFDVIAIAPPSAADGQIEAGQGFCPAGYIYHVGDYPGWGRVGNKGGGQRTSSDGCRNLCDSQYSCNSFEYSPTTRQCNLNTVAKPTQGPYKDFWFCEKACPTGYTKMIGDVPGWGRVNNVGGGRRVSNCNECARLCDGQRQCQSYECSTTDRKCNLNTRNTPNAGAYRNYLFCAKELCAPGYKWKLGDYPGWGRVNGVGGGRRVSNCDECGSLCDGQSQCKSYECSPSTRQCNLNYARDPTARAYKDFNFCSKI